jgi:ribonucleoside-diphosphate reductase alpha chain
VSYLSRFDLAHVDPSETGFDALGRGVEEGKSPPAQGATRYLSKGLTRSRTDNLVVMRGGADDARGAGSITAIASSGATARHGDVAEGATALKAEPERELSPTEKLEAQAWSKAGTAQVVTAPTKAERRAEAKAKGYEGEMCSECGNFTLVRNGTCMKCDTCGSTTGCS